MAPVSEWVLLAYRLPREPSTPRIAVWRRLRRLGVVQLGDGLVALPRDARTQEGLEWVAEDVVGAGGEATVWFAQAGSRAQERALSHRLDERVAAEYRTVLEAAREGGDRRMLARLRRGLRSIRSRDYSSPPERAQAEAAVERLAELVEAGG